MPETKKIVINTGPILALIAATGSLDILHDLYTQVCVPFEVQTEITSYGDTRFGVNEFTNADFLEKEPLPIKISPVLLNTLDLGEAAVIQLALDRQIPAVCIDEVTGRRIARLYNLNLTGSLGILLKAKKEGYPISITNSIKGMREKGIFISADLEIFALKLSGEME